MAKTSSGQNITGQVTKQTLRGIKNGSIKKDKKSKFKNTPAGKVALVDNVKAKNKNITSQKIFQKNSNVKNNQNSPKEKLKQLEGKENSLKRKQNSPKGKQNIPKGKRTPNELQNKQNSKKNNLIPKKVLEEFDDSDSDDDSFNEEEISFDDETFEDEEENDTDVPDIFGASLAENSDLDDEDFEEEEEGEESEDEESEDEEDEDVNISGEQEMVRSKDIQSSSNSEFCELSKDDTYDDDDEEDDEDDDDNDDDNESYEDMDMNEVDTSVSQSDDEEDEDEDENEDEDEDEDESEASGLKALLGKSMTDDDDDEDFNEEDEDDEDDDISDEEEDDDDDDEDDSTVKVVQEKAIKNKITKTSNSKDASEKNDQAQGKALSPEEQQEINKRTIFITNVPKETKETTLKKVFGQYGLINNIRFRGIIPSNLKTSKKVAAIKKDIHPEVHTLIVYINYKSEESAKKALCMNGKKFEGNYLNVTIVANSKGKEYDNKKAVFIGNLKFGMDTNPIWEIFNKCGEVDSIHLMRDKKTGQTRGFGYVNFKSEDAVALALKLDGTEVNNRPIRVHPIKVHDKEKHQKRNRRGWKNKSSPLNKSDDNRPSKKFKNDSQAVARSIGDEAKVKQKMPQRDNMSPEGKIAKSFQGQKSDMKNKKKGNKFNKKKKELAGKLMAKPKKQRS